MTCFIRQVIMIRLMLGMPQNTIEVVKALNYLIPSGGYDDLFQKLGFDRKHTG